MTFHASRLRALFLALWCVAGLAGPLSALSGNLVTPPPIQLTDATPTLSLDDRASFWIDTAPPGRQMDIQELEARSDTLPWQLRVHDHQYKIDGQVLWFRFDARTSQSNRHWYLELADSGLDRAVLYFRDPHGQWVSQEAGDTKPVSEWPLPGRFPTFELSHTVGQAVQYWLRVEHARVNFSVPVRIRQLSWLVTSRDREQFLLGIYFGLVVWVTVVAGANALAWRDGNFAAYAVYVAMLGLGQAAFLGTGAQ